MGNELIVPVICGAVITDKAESFRDTVISNTERRITIRISYDRISSIQEMAFCQILSKMAEKADIRQSYVKTIIINNTHDGTRDEQSFQMPMRAISTQDKNGYKIYIAPDGQDGYTIKASKAFWKDSALADMKFKESTSEEAIQNFMDDILAALKAKTKDGTTPSVENAEKISFWSRFWRTTLKVFAALIVIGLIVAAIWAFIVFAWPVIAAAFVTTTAVTTTAIIAPTAATVFNSIGMYAGCAALFSIPAGAVITTCTKER